MKYYLLHLSLCYECNMKKCYSISGDVAVRQKYKQYESDSSVPVPKSTKFWRKRKLRYLLSVYCKMRKYGALQI